MRQSFLQEHLSPKQWELINDKIYRYKIRNYIPLTVLSNAWLDRELLRIAGIYRANLLAADKKLASAYVKGKFPQDVPKTRLYNICLFFLWLHYDQESVFTPQTVLGKSKGSSDFVKANAKAMDRIMKKCRVYSCAYYGINALDTIYKEIDSLVNQKHENV